MEDLKKDLSEEDEEDDDEGEDFVSCSPPLPVLVSAAPWAFETEEDEDATEEAEEEPEDFRRPKRELTRPPLPIELVLRSSSSFNSPLLPPLNEL